MSCQFTKDFLKETKGKGKIFIKAGNGEYYTDSYVNYLKNRLKGAEEKVQQLIIYAKTL